MSPRYATVASLADSDYELIQDSAEVTELNRAFDTDYDLFFVLLGDGYYKEVYGVYGLVLYMHSRIYPVDISGSGYD